MTLPAMRAVRVETTAAMPIEQPSRYVFHVDLRVARELGIAIAQSVLVRADRVIE